MATIHRLIGMGGDQMVPALIGRDMPELDEAHSRYYRPHLDEVPVLPGAAELIAELHRREVTTAVATSGGPDDLEVLLGKIPTSSLIDHVVTGDDVGREQAGARPRRGRAARLRAPSRTSRCSSATRAGTSRPPAAPACRAWGCAPADGPSRSFATPARSTPTRTSAALLAHLDDSFIGQRLRALSGLSAAVTPR